MTVTAGLLLFFAYLAAIEAWIRRNGFLWFWSALIAMLAVLLLIAE